MLNNQKQLLDPVPNFNFNQGWYNIGETEQIEELRHYNAKQKKEYDQDFEAVIEETRRHE